MTCARSEQPATARLIRPRYIRWSITLYSLAWLGKQVGADLWDFHTEDKRSIRAALDLLLPYANGAKQWTISRSADSMAMRCSTCWSVQQRNMKTHATPQRL